MPRKLGQSVLLFSIRVMMVMVVKVSCVEQSMIICYVYKFEFNLNLIYLFYLSSIMFRSIERHTWRKLLSRDSCCGCIV